MTAREIIKTFLPGNQHVAEMIIDTLRDQGFEIVAIKPTDDMLDAGARAWSSPGRRHAHRREAARRVYQAMRGRD